VVADIAVGFFRSDKKLGEQQLRGPAAAPYQPASSQAERNIHLCNIHVNMLWSPFLSMQ
jgi:hypothetical protein